MARRRRTPQPNTFPDRSFREGFLTPEHLRTLTRALMPEIADLLDYNNFEILPPPCPLDDWRFRDRDVLVRLRYLDPADQRQLLVCLIEHQSDEDPAMPLRLLVYAVLYWEREWKAWEEHHERGQPLQLTPILPMVLHTGAEPWKTNRELGDLFATTELLKQLQPQWRMPLWDLAEHSTSELLASDDLFLKELAVVRASREATESAFLAVYESVLRSLEPLARTQPVRFKEPLVWLLSWAIFRRPRAEQPEILRATKASAAVAQETKTMGQNFRTYEDELQELWQKIEAEYDRMEWLEEALEKQTAAREAAEKAAREAAVANSRGVLRRQLTRRFGDLPPEVVAWVQNASAEALDAALDQVHELKSLDELALGKPPA